MDKLHLHSNHKSSMRNILFLFCLLIGMSTSVFSQCYVKEYSTNRRILKVDGDYVLDYSSNQRLYKFENEYLVSYSGYKRLLKFEGDYIVRVSDYKRVAKLDGNYVIQYSNYRRIAVLDCPGRRSAMAAAAYLLN